MSTRSARRPARAAVPAYRRSPHLVVAWHGRQLVLHQYARGTRTAASARVVALLDACATWSDLPAIARGLPGVAGRDVERLVAGLVARGLLERSDAPRDARDDGARTWGAWQPEAGLFHQCSRDVPFWPRETANVALRARARRDPPPPATLERAPLSPDLVRDLPRIDVDSPLAGTLRARRTWRRFGGGALTLDELSALLGLTWGVQAWVRVAGFGDMPLKTAPSGGARHAVEAYVAVRRVDGLAPGVYHYRADAHRLVGLRRGLTKAALAVCVPQQAWMAGAAVMIFMTAVLARTQWRYPFSRAYRTVLAETGHHAQTCCLVATERGLAPFCTMALADTVTEQLIGTDAWREPVLYAVGVGRRPAAAWAPWPDTRRTPARRDRVPGEA